MPEGSVMETIEPVLEEGAEVVSEIIQVACECPDYSEQLANIQATLEMINANSVVNTEFVGYLAGFGLFAVIVALCYFGYKFFRMFF